MLTDRKGLADLLLVIAIEEYGLKHHMPSADVFDFFEKHQLFPLFLSQQEILRVLFHEESARSSTNPLALEIFRAREKLPLSRKYVHKEIDLTVDIYEKIHRVTELIAEEKHISFEEALGQFVKSHAYWCLQTPATAMWGESDEFILNEFMAEKKSAP